RQRSDVGSGVSDTERPPSDGSRDRRRVRLTGLDAVSGGNGSALVVLPFGAHPRGAPAAVAIMRRPAIVPAFAGPAVAAAIDVAPRAVAYAVEAVRARPARGE